MKILLWPAYYLPSMGGLEVMTHALTKALQKQGHDVCVISTNMRSNEIIELHIDHVPVFLFPFVNALLHNDLSLLKKTHLSSQRSLRSL